MPIVHVLLLSWAGFPKVHRYILRRSIVTSPSRFPKTIANGALENARNVTAASHHSQNIKGVVRCFFTDSQGHANTQTIYKQSIYV